MRAGFAKRRITPEVGCMMEGFNLKEPASAIHDDLFVRAIWLQGVGRGTLLTLAIDLLFMERKEAGRIKKRLREAFGLDDQDILINFSHNHSGPRLTRWHYSGEPDPAYIEKVAEAAAEAAEEAQKNLREATIHAGAGTTTLPISRRRPNAQGLVEWGPCASAPVCGHLPVCLFRGSDGGIIAEMFSVSCHPTINHSSIISAEYPGAAVEELNKRFNTGGFVFLQGGGGDAKPRNIAVGDDHFRDGSWDDVREAGLLVAGDVAAVIESSLQPMPPAIGAALFEIALKLDSPPTREELEKTVADSGEDEGRRAWAADMLKRIEQGPLPDAATVLVHGARIASGLVIIGLEAELGAELAELIVKTAGEKVVFALGYTNGVRLNLPCDRQLPQGGYGVETSWEFHWPAKLRNGIDDAVAAAVRKIMDKMSLL